METNELIQQLASAIHYWLSYVSLCSNSNLLAENSVRYPFVEFLERKCGTAINLEKQHELFPERHIDFCFEYGKYALFVELKYASKYTRGKAEKQRVFNDLVRLALMVNVNSKNKGFFIMCGDTQTFTVNFMRIVDGRKVNKNKLRQDREKTASEIEPQGEYSEWFGFEKDEEKNIQLKGNCWADTFMQDYFGKEAEKQEIEFSAIKTKRAAFLPAKNQTSRSHTVAIWEVTVVKEGKIER